MKKVRGNDQKYRSEKKFLLELFLVCFLACLLISTCYLIITKLNPYGINSDVSNEISFKRYTWEQKTLIPKDFVAGHELAANRPVLLYWLFYAITKDFLLAHQLENITILFIQMAAFWFLFAKLKLDRCVRLVVLCMYFCVWTVGNDSNNFNMYAFQDIYSIFVLAVLLTLALRISILEKEENWWKGVSLFHLIALLMISAGLGFTSIRLAMSLYVPLVVVDGINCFVNFINGRQITKKLSKTTAIDTVCLLLNIGSYGVTLRFLSDSFNPVGFNIVGINSLLNWSILSTQLAIVVSTFGISGSGPLFSPGGVSFLFRSCFALFSLIAIVWLLQMKKEQSPERFDETKGIVWYYISTTLVLFGMGVFGGGVISKRYYWASALMILLVNGTAMDRWMRLIEEKKKLAVCGIVTVGLVILFGVNLKIYSITYSSEPPLLAQVANYIHENGYQYVTATYWNAGAVEGYTNGAVGYQHDIDMTGELVERAWAIDIAKFEQERSGVPNILLLTDDEETIVLANPYSNYLVNNFGEKVQEIGIYNLYAFTENPFTLQEKVKTTLTAGLPAAGVNEKTDMLSNIGFVFNNAFLNDDGELVTDGSAGSGFFGPYFQSVDGTYNITMHYIVDSYPEQDFGEFDVALDMERIAADFFYADQTSVTLENVTIGEGQLFEVRMAAPEGMIVRVQSIHYERVEQTN